MERMIDSRPSRTAALCPALDGGYPSEPVGACGAVRLLAKVSSLLGFLRLPLPARGGQWKNPAEY